MNTGQRRNYTLKMALAGLVSGVLTVCATELHGSFVSFLFLGGVFGVVISAYLAVSGASLRLWSATRFTVVCCGAYFFSFLGTFWVPLLLPWDRWTMSHNPSDSPVAFFVGGSLGGFLVLSEALFLLRPEVPWKDSLLNGLRWSPVGGALGAIGALLGSHPAGNFSPVLFLVWQTGMAGVIGFVASRHVTIASKFPGLPTALEKTVPSARRLPIAYMVFFVSIVGVLSYYAIGGISSEHAAGARQCRIAAAMVTAPPAANLPTIVPIPAEQALVVHTIAGNVPVLPYGRPTSNEPPTYDYSIGYQQRPMASGSDFRPVVQVSVTEYPNSEWAKYRLKDVPVPNSAVFYEKYIQKVTKFGNVVYEDTGWRYPNGTGDLYYYWASEQYVVVVKFTGTTIDDQFLQAYLERYPSSP